MKTKKIHFYPLKISKLDANMNSKHNTINYGIFYFPKIVLPKVEVVFLKTYVHLLINFRYFVLKWSGSGPYK